MTFPKVSLEKREKKMDLGVEWALNHRSAVKHTSLNNSTESMFLKRCKKWVFILLKVARTGE